MKKLIILFLIPSFVFAQTDFTVYVNPFIGTGGHGHTFPGATVPFGMVQLSPDTRLNGWDGCSGYHFSDKKIYGFSHTHLSGTGCSDYGDILIMPTTGKAAWSNKKYASVFQKSTEKATTGFYSVFREKWKVLAELTATARTGLHRYTFPASEEAGILIDLTHRDKVNESSITISSDREITGHRVSSNWSSGQHVYFVIQFSTPFAKVSIKDGSVVHSGNKSRTGRSLKAHLQFTTKQDEVILVKVGISPVSIDGARKNLEAEQPGFDFRAVLQKAIDKWNKELGKIVIESDKLQEKRVFLFLTISCYDCPKYFSGC